MNIFMPARVFTGYGVIRAHSADFKHFGKRCLILTGKHAAEKSGALGDVCAVLNANEIAYSVFDGIQSNPTVKSCIQAGRTATESDFIIGIGGGSVLDAAKAVSVFAANTGLDENGFYAKEWLNAPLPVILVGTTAGTGSEVTKVSVLTDSKGKKHSIHDDRLYARLSFGDPGYLKSVSPETALYTGADILMHAIESYFSKKADAFSKGCSVKAVSVSIALINAMADEKAPDDGSLAALYEASLLAGMAINTTGTCFPHNVGYYLTEKYGVPHGAACAVFLPEFISHVKATDEAAFNSFISEAQCTEEELLRPAGVILSRLSVQFKKGETDSVLSRWENNGSVKNTIGNVTMEQIRNALIKFEEEN